MTGRRCVQVAGLKSQPGGMSRAILRHQVRDRGKQGEFVTVIPLRGIAFQRSDHARQGVAERMLRLPSERCPGAADIQRVVVVSQIDHPRLDEWFLDQRHIIQHPGARFRDRLGNLVRLPLFTVN